MIKKLTTVFVILLNMLPLVAQNLRVADKNYNQQFTEVRKSFDGTTVVYQGKLEYKNDGYLLMNYDNGEFFLIDGDSMTIDRDGVKQTFDTSKNLMMKALNNALMFSFQGKLKELAEEQQADIVTGKEGSDIVVTLTARKKQVRGYSKITVWYKADGSIYKMQMDEFTGATTLYTLK